MNAETIATELTKHYPEPGMKVASGQTCVCGYWNGSETERVANDRCRGAEIDSIYTEVES